MFNMQIIVGHLGADPEKRTTNAGTSVVNLSVATSETWKDKETGERREKTEWHRIVAFGPMADATAEYTRKGSLVLVAGTPETERRTDNANVERTTVKIKADSIKFLSKAPGTD